MMTFSRTIRVDGNLTDADSLPLITITRTTDMVVVQASTAMTRTSLGKYTYTYTGTPGLTYRASYTIVVLGNTTTSSSDQIEGVATPTSPLFTYAEFERRWGRKNIIKASNKENNTAAPDYDTIQDSFSFAVTEINNAMDGMFITPLDWTDNGDVVDPIVAEWGKVIAWHYIYEARGWDEVIKGGGRNRITKLLEKVYDEMSLIRAGVRTIPALRSREDDSGNFPDAGGGAIMPYNCRYSSRVAHYLGQVLVY